MPLRSDSRDAEDRIKYGSQLATCDASFIRFALHSATGIAAAAKDAIAHLCRDELEGFCIHSMRIVSTMQ